MRAQTHTNTLDSTSMQHTSTCDDRGTHETKYQNPLSPRIMRLKPNFHGNTHTHSQFQLTCRSNALDIHEGRHIHPLATIEAHNAAHMRNPLSPRITRPKYQN